MLDLIEPGWPRALAAIAYAVFIVFWVGLMVIPAAKILLGKKPPPERTRGDW